MSHLRGRPAAHHELRRYPWRVRDSGQLLLMVAAGVWLVAAVAQTSAEGLRDPRIAIAFGALIAFGEVLRLNLPGVTGKPRRSGSRARSPTPCSSGSACTSSTPAPSRW